MAKKFPILPKAYAAECVMSLPQVTQPKDTYCTRSMVALTAAGQGSGRERTPGWQSCQGCYAVAPSLAPDPIKACAHTHAERNNGHFHVHVTAILFWEVVKN